MHWSATVCVLGASFIMSCVRAWVRRGLTKSPLWLPGLDSQELPWLVERIVKDDWTELARVRPEWRDWDPGLSLDFEWGPLVGVLERITMRNSRLRQLTRLNDLTFEKLLSFDIKDEQIMELIRSCKEYIEGLDDVSTQELSTCFVPHDTQPQCFAVKIAERAIEAMPSLKHGGFTDLGNSLAMALRGIMSKLERKVSWTFGRAPWNRQDWCITVRHGRREKDLWCIPLIEWHEKQHLGLNLSLGLYLWNYTFFRWGKALWTLHEDCDFRAAGFDVYTCDELPHVKVVGSLDWCSLRSLSAWLPGFHLVNFGDADTSDTTSEDHDQSTRREDSDQEDAASETPRWHVPLCKFGLLNSSVFE